MGHLVVAVHHYHLAVHRIWVAWGVVTEAVGDTVVPHRVACTAVVMGITVVHQEAEVETVTGIVVVGTMIVPGNDIGPVAVVQKDDTDDPDTKQMSIFMKYREEKISVESVQERSQANQICHNSFFG